MSKYLRDSYQIVNVNGSGNSNLFHFTIIAIRKKATKPYERVKSCILLRATQSKDVNRMNIGTHTQTHSQINRPRQTISFHFFFEPVQKCATNDWPLQLWILNCSHESNYLIIDKKKRSIFLIQIILLMNVFHDGKILYTHRWRPAFVLMQLTRKLNKSTCWTDP